MAILSKTNLNNVDAPVEIKKTLKKTTIAPGKKLLKRTAPPPLPTAEELAVAKKESAERVETNQERRAKFLTPAQHEWKKMQWELFIDEHGLTPSDELKEDVLNQLNYGRALLREQREAAKKLDPKKTIAEAKAAMPPMPKMTVTNNVSEVERMAQDLARKKEAERVNKMLQVEKPELVEKFKEATKAIGYVADSNAVEEAREKLADQLYQELEVGQLAEEEEDGWDDEPIDEVALMYGTKAEAEDDATINPTLPELEPPVESPIVRPLLDDAEIKMMEANPREKMWQTAEQLARNGKMDEWKTLGMQMQKMVEYCYNQIKETGQVEMPFEDIDIFWHRFTFKEIDHGPAIQTRRELLITKVLGYWRKRMEKLNLTTLPKTNSYRFILAARQMENVIEKFAFNALKAGQPDHRPDEQFYDVAAKRAKDLFESRFPIPNELIKPGPITLIDPDFFTYLKICSEHNLEVGQLLHEVIK